MLRQDGPGQEAKALNLDAIHDTVHEMAKDELAMAAALRAC